MKTNVIQALVLVFAFLFLPAFFLSSYTEVVGKTDWAAFKKMAGERAYWAMAFRQMKEGENDQIGLSVRRYRKGLELIRLLYEKALSLEYHFASLRLNQQVDKLSNPMNFELFRESIEALEKVSKGEGQLALPDVLLKSPEGGALYLMTAALNGKGRVENRREVLDKSACLLRFLLEMQTDLKSIYYENHLLYLRTTELRQRCERLFADYVKAVHYTKTLPECRTLDDWASLDLLIAQTEKTIRKGEETRDVDVKNIAYQHHINLEFSVDRLLDYMDFYDEVLTAGRHMYREWELILQHLTTVESCTTQVPKELLSLQQDISDAIIRFDRAYETVELKGSRLKDLLYGYYKLEEED